MANDNAFPQRLLRASDLTFSTAISAEYAAEETQKHAQNILQLMRSVDFTTKLPTKNQKKKKLRNENFEMALIPEETAQHMESRV